MEGELIQQSSTIMGALVGAIVIVGLLYFGYTCIKKYIERKGKISEGGKDSGDQRRH